ncbi:MAG: hypothetical protein BGO70_03495 [Bacteroidetes bacterium 43-93]|nr:MAG: hypothetical protein BGO70_03495 [Bacteroidetes bacterium 43-93]
MSTLDRYFRYPVLWDYVFASIASAISYYLVLKHMLTLPTAERIYSTVSDLANTSLTLAGFVLTLLTVLISFKSSSKMINEDIKSTDTLFDVFFSSALYFRTVFHLKNAIKSLTLISLVGYILKLLMTDSLRQYLFFFSFFAVTIILFTLWRCIVILNQIVKLQQNNRHTDS